MLFAIALALLIIIVSIIYYWAYQRKTFWKRHNVPHIESPLFLGNFAKTMILQEHIEVTFDRLYNHAVAKNQPFIGVNVFHKPTIILRDPELIKRILVKDFSSFNDRHTGGDPHYDPIGANNIFQLKNPKWRAVRNKISPVFTSGKMKQMFYMVEDIGNQLNEHVKKLALNNGNCTELEVKELAGYFTAESICLVAFGTVGNCIRSPKTSEFLLNAQESFMNTTWNKLAFNALFFLPDLMPWIKFKTFATGFEEFLTRVLKDVMADRIKTGNIRNDLIDSLIAIQNSEKDLDEKIFTEDIVLAQAVVFFAAGFETSSSTISFALYEIARNKDIQTRVRNEIHDVLEKHDGKLTHDALANEFTYLTQVVQETLRMYPILGFLDRVCVEDGYSLEPYSNFKIPKDMPIFIPALSLHKDPEYFPNPKEFNPDRFDPNNKTYNEYTYMPFGIGPHNCIGERFGLMQVKTALVSLLKSFNIELGSNTPIPLNLDESCILYRTKGGIRIKFTLDEK